MKALAAGSPAGAFVDIGYGGGRGWPGHAVNPSMGARWRHPWRQLIWPPENGRHEAVSGGSPELPGVVVR
ncbi:hypothetical protein, partial [Stenotrophomonas maltophilia]|uniref:hypothetical protein n=1 Tax=Stenotrophomonas maltophilia TaxID=40324 RepID=UPI001C61050F